MRQKFYDAVVGNPIIAAVKDEKGLEKCLFSDASVVFILYGEISSIEDIVRKIKEHDKIAIVHLDLISGFSATESAVDFIKKYTNADGIISTRIDQIRRARILGLDTIYRVFVIDSKAFENVKKHSRDIADFIEILPGVMPKVIRKISNLTQTPIIAGGLISDKEDVYESLNAGAIAISTTNSDVWEM